MSEIKALFYETDITLAEIEEMLAEIQAMLEVDINV
jgi:hypothetical protein